MVFPAQPSAPAPINDQKSPQFESQNQKNIASQFADIAAQPPQQSDVLVGYSERGGEAFCQVQQQRESAAPQISQDEKQEQLPKQNQQYQQARQEQSQQQAQQAQETEQDQLEQQLQRLKLDQQLQHEKQHKPEQVQEQEQEAEEQLQQQKKWQSENEQQLQQIQQLQQAIQDQQAIIQQQQEQAQQQQQEQQRRQSYLPQLPASAQTYPKSTPLEPPRPSSLPAHQHTQQQQATQQPQQHTYQPQQFYQPQPQHYHPQLSPSPLSFNNAQTQPIYQPPHHFRHNSTTSTLSNSSTRPHSVASILPPYSTPSSTPGHASTPYFPPPPKYATLSAASSTAKPYAPSDYFSQGGYASQPQGMPCGPGDAGAQKLAEANAQGWRWGAPQQQVVGAGAEPDYGAPPPPPAAWR
jgi:hypothetical protein